MEFKLPEKCMECDKPIEHQGHLECLKCGNQCTPYVLNQGELNGLEDGDMVGLDVKSNCCRDDVKMVNVRSTCSSVCHEKVVVKMEEKMGKSFFDRDPEGVLREIPTRDLFEKGGLTMDELRAYPKAKIQGEA